MAFIKDRKGEMLNSYNEWLDKSQAVFMMEYSKMNMPQVNEMQKQIRAAGGESHVVKNTLFKKALDGKEYSSEELTKTTLVGFAFNDPAAVAKVVADLCKKNGYKIKCGYLGKTALTDKEVKNLASLPPLPVLRAHLLGTIMAPASQLVRTFNEPGRSLAAVVQAHVDASPNEEAPAEAK